MAGPVSGQATKTFAIADDNATSPVYREFKDFIDLWEIVYEDGASERTPHGSAATDHEFLLENHRVNFTFTPDTGDNEPVPKLLVFGKRGTKRAFKAAVESPTSGKGYQVSGVCYVVRTRVPFAQDRSVRAEASLIMAGLAWVETSTVS